MKTYSNQLHVGGTLSSDYKYYIEREADKQLYENLRNGEFSYVLTARQMGKSSLRARTMEKLEQEGYLCLMLDVTGLVSADTSANEWYFTFVHEINTLHPVVADLRKWWDAQEPLLPIAKMNRFLKELFLPQIKTEVVIFIDEIDKLLSLQNNRFRIDDFFAAIRAYYNARVDEPELRRLNFAFFGVAAPDDLINDPQRTPFNIGKSIELRNFYLHELAVFNEALSHLKVDTDTLLREIYHWTSGQPILTARLVKAIAENEFYFHDIPEKVEAYVQEIIRKDENEHFQNIENRIRRDADHGAQMLTLYQQLYHGIKVKCNPANDAHIYLKLTGLIAINGDSLWINNRIYKEVFDNEWITDILQQFHRPYAAEMNEWLKNGCTREFCLKGKQLKQAERISMKRHDLAQIEHQFVHASQIDSRRRNRRKIYALIAFVAIFTIVSAAIYNLFIKSRDTLHEVNQEYHQLDSTHNALVQTRKQLKLATDSLEMKNEDYRHKTEALNQTKQQLKQRNARVSAQNTAIEKEKVASELAYKAKNLMKVHPSKALEYASEANKLSNDDLYKATLYEAYREYVFADTLSDPPEAVEAAYWYNNLLYLVAFDDARPKIYQYSQEGRLLKHANLRKTPRSIHVTPADSLYVFYGDTMDVFNPDFALESTLPLGGNYWFVHYDTRLGEVMGLNINGQLCRGLASGKKRCKKMVEEGIIDAEFMDRVKRIAVSSGSTISIYDYAGNKHNEMALGQRINDFAYSPALHTFVIATGDSRLHFWKLASNRCISKNVREEVYVLEMNRAGTMFLASPGDHSIQIRAMNGQLVNALYGISGRSRILSLSDDNRFIATKGSAALKIWRHTVPEVHYFDNNLQWSSYSAIDSSFYGISGDTLQQLHRRKGIVLRKVLPGGPVKNAAISPDAGRMAWIGQERGVGVYSLRGDSTRRLSLALTNVADLAFSAAGNALYMSTLEGCVLKQSLSGKRLDTVMQKRNRKWQKLAVNAENSYLAVADSNNLYVKALGSNTYQKISDNFEPISTLRFAGPNTLLFSERNHEVVLFHLRQMKRLNFRDLKYNAAYIDWNSVREALLVVPAFGKAVLRNSADRTFQETVDFQDKFVNAAFLPGEAGFYLATEGGQVYVHRLKPPLTAFR